jgi:hypothetical protein
MTKEQAHALLLRIAGKPSDPAILLTAIDALERIEKGEQSENVLTEDEARLLARFFDGTDSGGQSIGEVFVEALFAPSEWEIGSSIRMDIYTKLVTLGKVM